MPGGVEGCALFPCVAKGEKEGKNQLSNLCDGANGVGESGRKGELAWASRRLF